MKMLRMRAPHGREVEASARCDWRGHRSVATGLWVDRDRASREHVVVALKPKQVRRLMRWLKAWLLENGETE